MSEFLHCCLSKHFPSDDVFCGVYEASKVHEVFPAGVIFSGYMCCILFLIHCNQDFIVSEVITIW